MATLLYIFPHPDDESFGPAPVLVRQRRQGHAVHLLTLTQGEATSQRAKYCYSKSEMGRVRHAEMQDVAKVLDLTSLTVLDFPDGELADLDPRTLERAIAERIEAVRPDVVVTYAVHGISGHPDHLVTHAVVKRVFCALRDEASEHAPRRLAFFTLAENDNTGRPAHLKGSPDAAIDCIVSFSEEDKRQGEQALACYRTYQDIVREHQPLEHVKGGVRFILFGEDHEERLDSLAAGLD